MEVISVDKSFVESCSWGCDFGCTLYQINQQFLLKFENCNMYIRPRTFLTHLRHGTPDHGMKGLNEQTAGDMYLFICIYNDDQMVNIGYGLDVSVIEDEISKITKKKVSFDNHEIGEYFWDNEYETIMIQKHYVIGKIKDLTNLESFREIVNKLKKLIKTFNENIYGAFKELFDIINSAKNHVPKSCFMKPQWKYDIDYWGTETDGEFDLKEDRKNWYDIFLNENPNIPHVIKEGLIRI